MLKYKLYTRMLTFKPSFYEINKCFEISYTHIVNPVLIADLDFA